MLETALEIAVRDRRSSEREIEVMKLDQYHQPMAVALRFDVDFADMFADSDGLMSFSSQLLEGMSSFNHPSFSWIVQLVHGH